MGCSTEILTPRPIRFLLAIAGALAGGAAVAECTPTQVELRGDWGQARFSVEIADSGEERAIGLMNRPSLPKSAGMLFIYDRPQPVAFWMKNTLIPLDMIFIDEAGVVQRVHSNAVPLDTTPIDGGPGIIAVLEVNGGLAEAMGIGQGSQVRHPGLDQEKGAWPCE